MLHTTVAFRDTATIQPSTQVDYYDLLVIPRDASQDDITRAWRRLVLIHHPDKSGSTSVPAKESTVDIRLVNEARWVLSDSARRKEWEERFFDGSGDYPVALPKDHTPHIFHDISLSDFTPHFHPEIVSSDVVADNDDEREPTHYTHPCRCSGEFCITTSDLEAGIEIIGCEGCGEWVRVGYEVLEEDAEGGHSQGEEGEDGQEQVAPSAES